MKYIFAALFLIVFLPATKAQIQMETRFPDIRDKKGSLITVNEMHGALANTNVYLDILKHIHGQQPADTINLFLEVPFSMAVWCNDFLSSGGKTLLPKGVYPSPEFWNQIVAQQIPAKIFGCDFEYDEQYKRNQSFVYLLRKTSDDLAAASMDTSLISAYIGLVNGFKLTAKDTRSLISQLQGMQVNAAPSLKARIGQMLFALNAPQKFGSGRDEFIYERALEGIALHYFNYENRINVLIHGVAHINPAYKNSLFNRLRNSKDSPFAGKCFLIGNVYLDCKNNSGIFQHETISSFSFYALAKDDKPVTDFFKTLKLTPQQVYFLPVPEFTSVHFSGLKQEELLGVYVHEAIVN
ncbi:hypothetical protein [Taibaiella soli]|nr:hypothetical protein [Taibaiella soli]